jgi:hypothetical protein
VRVRDHPRGSRSCFVHNSSELRNPRTPQLSYNPSVSEPRVGFFTRTDPNEQESGMWVPSDPGMAAREGSCTLIN